MERDRLIKEIHYLADRIRTNAHDADSLLADVAHLYEMVVLLKHLPAETKNDMEPLAAEPKEEKTVTEPIDLFSQPAEPEAAPVEPVSKRETVVIQKTEESVAEKLLHKRIADLKAAIGINERFQFINELFDGNMKEYTVAVDQINSFSSRSEAESYLANLEGIYKWTPDSHIASNFKELVERRFA